MSITTWDFPLPNGWFPKISPNGKHVYFGHGNEGYLHNRETGSIYRIDGRCFGVDWWNDTAMIVQDDDRMYQVSVTDAVKRPFFDRFFTDAGVGNMKWAGFIASRPPEAWQDGRKLALDTSRFQGCSVDRSTGDAYFGESDVPGGDGKRLVLVRDGVKVGSFAARSNISTFRAGAGGYVGYGYYDDAWLLTPDGQHYDVSVTPNKVEGPPLPFVYGGHIWLVSTHDTGAFIRPFGDRAVIFVPHDGCVFVDLRVVGDTFIVATNDNRPGAHAKVHVVPATEPRRPVTLPTPQPPTPEPPKPEPPTPEPPKPPMTKRMPAEVSAIIRAFAARPEYDALRKGNDDQRREYTKKIVEQLRLSVGPKWGWKRASKGRPDSKDGIANLETGPNVTTVRLLDGRFTDAPKTALYLWDIQNGSSREPVTGHESYDANASKDQVFVEVRPVDHLGISTPPSQEPPKPEPPKEEPPKQEPPQAPTQCDAHVILDAVTAMFTALNERLDRLETAQVTGSINLPGWLGGKVPVELGPIRKE